MVVMARFFSKFFVLALTVITHVLVLDTTITSSSWCPINSNAIAKFKQRTDRFWKFDEQLSRWVEIKLPFDLLSCLDGNCNKVGSIEETKKGDDGDSPKLKHKERAVVDDEVLPMRKRISLTRMSDSSIWVTGESGSIYERFWNGVQWVIAPHELPIMAGGAVSVFFVNQTILALSEAGILFQLQLIENSQPIWTEFMPSFESSVHGADTETSSTMLVKSGILSDDGKRLYFTTKNGSLIEFNELQPLSWIHHGRPPGGDVSAIADSATMRQDVIYTVSSTGDLYEFDKSSKPSWKKHIWGESTKEEISLKASRGCTLHGLAGPHSHSLFLLTKSGNLMERRLNQRKWKWIDHGSPEGYQLTAITPVEQNELNERVFSLFFTTAGGIIFEYRLPKQSGATQENQISETWVNHNHPPYAKVARGVSGLQLQVGRILFPLDDGRLAELHLSGIGGEGSGPTSQINIRRKSSQIYEWSVLDAPETEGWNTEYCTEEHGPFNCILGTKDAYSDGNPNDSGIISSKRRRKEETYRSYISPRDHGSSLSESLNQNDFITDSIYTSFHMRAMQADRSFFIIADGGLTFEYMYTEDVWLWLRHEHSAAMKGVLGHYNGSLFLVDTEGNLLIRERSGSDLSWTNCTAMPKGKQVVTGPPWDGSLDLPRKVTAEDAIFFVSKNGRLLQFTVALRKFMWKNCRNPPNTKIASIIDQEVFRMNVVFVVGRNGRLYQYNRVTELWHQHHQSPHLVLSRLTGTASRLSPSSLTGSLFTLSEDGGLVEYHWNALAGWNWVEHGTPNKNATLVSAPGPCFQGNQLFLVASDGTVYLRYLEQRTWQWKSYGFPHEESTNSKSEARQEKNDQCNKDWAINKDNAPVQNEQSSVDHSVSCDEKVASVRPVAFSEDSVIFELRDGRLAELRRTEEKQWEWSRIIGTPTSPCTTNYWTALAA